MKFYDIAEINVNNDFASRLGYTKIFGPGDIIEIDDKQKRPDSVWIFRGSNTGEISRAIKGRAIGIVMDSFTVEKSIIEEVAGYGKIICSAVYIAYVTGAKRCILLAAPVHAQYECLAAVVSYHSRICIYVEPLP